MSSNSDYSSHYGTPEPLITPLSSPHPWQNDPAFGIVHSTGCKTCRDFMGHVVTASQNHETTFQEAVKERDRQITVRFLDGVREGRRIQRDRDLERLTRCRSERNQAFDLNSEYRSRLLALEEELRDTKDRLLMLQIAYGEVSHVDHPFISDGEDSNSEGFSTVEMQSVLFASSISDGSPGLHSAEHTELLEPIPLQIPAPGATSDLDSHDTDGSQSDVPAVVCVSSTISGDWSCARQYPESRSPSPAGSHNNISSSDDEALTESSSNDSSASSSSSSAASVSLSLIPYSASSPEDDDDPQDLETLKALMAAAHDPNNTRELDRVRALCTRAHRTTRRQRTDLQKYILLSWRSPQMSNNLSLPAETSTRRLACEIFVDASRIGIGFISSGRWHAWKLIPGWKKEGRDTSWSEMVAVELGLRTLAAAGYRSADITLRSDNGGVVSSLHSKSARNPHESIILQEIFSICTAYDIHLIPKWISTKENPADNPSRGVYPSRSLLFPTSPPLPAHLLSFIQPVIV